MKVKGIKGFFNQIIHPFLGNRNQYNIKKNAILYPINALIGLILIPLKTAELLGFSFLLNFIFQTFSSTRKLTTYEIKELKTVFKDSIDYSKIYINETSKWSKFGAKLTNVKHLGFVWMQTINFSRPIETETDVNDMSWLIHEAVHVSQFNALGIQYIFEALIAQHIGGYSFGGEIELTNSNPLKYYNLEQQADIIRFIYLKENKINHHHLLIDNLINQNF